MKAYWRSCSFLLGYVLETAFKNDIFIDLCINPHSSSKNISYKLCL